MSMFGGIQTVLHINYYFIIANVFIFLKQGVISVSSTNDTLILR